MKNELNLVVSAITFFMVEATSKFTSRVLEKPNINEFIANNTYICSWTQSMDGSEIHFFSEHDEKCNNCQKQEKTKACGVKMQNNTRSEIGCFDIPRLCKEAFDLRYPEEYNLFIKENTVFRSSLKKNKVLKRKVNYIGTTTMKPTSTTTKKQCRDNHSLCCFWATNGECEQNPFWMRINCAKTCGTCACSLGNADSCISTGIVCKISTTTTPKIVLTTTKPIQKTKETTTATTTQKTKILRTTTTQPETTEKQTSSTKKSCADYHHQCIFWAMVGECEKNPFYMHPNCPDACRTCGKKVDAVYAPTPRSGCDNGHDLCNYWAHIGECELNPNYMLPNCRLACRVC